MPSWLLNWHHCLAAEISSLRPSIEIKRKETSGLSRPENGGKGRKGPEIGAWRALGGAAEV
jgi:hypothetical protein